MKIIGLSLLLICSITKAEIIRLPIEFGPSRALTLDTSIKKDEIDTQVNSFGGSLSSAKGHCANATINVLKSDGTINYAHKYEKGTVTFDSNFVSNDIETQINSIGSSFASIKGHRASTAINLTKNYGLLNYAHKNIDRTVTFDTNISGERITPKINSVGGSITGSSGHGISAMFNTTGSGGVINYTHVNNRTKFKFSGGVNVNNDIHGVNIGLQLPLGIK